MPPDALKPVYAIWGEDREKIDRALARLVSRVAAEGGMPAERLRAEETPAEEIVAACEALAFGGQRLVIVDGVDAWKAADAAPLVAYVASPNEMTCLAMVSGGAPTPKLLAAVQAAGGELRFGPDPKASRKERVAWLVQHFRAEVERAGGSASPAVARAVVDRVLVEGQGRGAALTAMELSREAGKLAAYADGEAIGMEMVNALVPPQPDAKIYELADAIVVGDAAATYDVLQDLATGDDPKAPILIQTQLANRLRSLAAAQALGPAPSADAVGEATGIKGYPARILAEQVGRMPSGAARQAVARAATLEIDLRMSAQRDLGRSPGDGERLVLETAARGLLALMRGTPRPEG